MVVAITAALGNIITWVVIGFFGIGWKILKDHFNQKELNEEVKQMKIEMSKLEDKINKLDDEQDTIRITLAELSGMRQDVKDLGKKIDDFMMMKMKS